MVSELEGRNLSSVAKRQGEPAVRLKLDYSGGNPLLPSANACVASARVHVPIEIAELPLHHSCSAELPSSPALSHSGKNVGGRILKIFKLRRKANNPAEAFSQEALQPALTTFRFQDQSGMSCKRFVPVEDVDLERYHYDSDEHSENVSTSGASCVDARRRRDSCSTSASSSTRSSPSAQSFNSMTSRSSLTTPRTSFLLSGGHQSGAQLMASILISISGLENDDEHSSEFDHPPVNGPRESAWHQPHDEILAASPARTARHGSAKHSSGRITPRIGRCSLDVHLTSPGPSRRFGKLDLSRIDRYR